MKSAAESYQLLTEGNARYSGESSLNAQTAPPDNRAHAYIAQQRPHTIVVGCSDSRVPVEMIFDQGAGDLFVVRVAGNILVPALVGSVEFAATEFGSRLVVVLGHTRCGAIGATIQCVQASQAAPSDNINAIVERISPSVSELIESDEAAGLSADELNVKAMRANVRASVEQLRNDSPVLAPLIRNEGLRVVGADFNIETGMVDFFDGAPV